MRHLIVRTLLLGAFPIGLSSQTPAPTQLDWSADDSARIAFVTEHGQVYRSAHVIVWAPADSVDSGWLASFADSLGSSLASLKAMIGGPYSWQRLGNRPVLFYFSPGRFVSHASGRDAVFISLSHIRRGLAPFLHEASHELLAPPPPFYPYEYPDSIAEERVAADFPQWLSEGLPDYLAQATAAATGFREGDVFEIGGLAKVDSTCVARLSGSPRQTEILAKVGGQGRLEALFTTDRAEVAPVFYACSQSFTKYLVDRLGVRAVVALFPRIQDGTWLVDLARVAGQPLPALRRAWLDSLRWSPAPPN
jgi:hypothetical protein